MRIRKLLQELCPDGIEYVSLNKVIDYIQPTRFIVDSTDYKSYGIPVLTAGKTFLLGYTDEVDCVFRSDAHNPVMIFDDFTTSMHWVDFDFKVKSSALKILVLKGQDAILRYLYYSIKSLDYSLSESTHERHWISKYSRLEIPLPPLPIQEEIVRILDEFTELQAELEAELEARTKQYEYYRNQLLDYSTGSVGFPHIDKMLKELCPDGVEFLNLQSISSSIFRGYGIKRSDIKEDGVPCVRYGEIYTKFDLYVRDVNTFTDISSVKEEKSVSYGDVLFAITGEKIEEIGKSVVYLADYQSYVGGDIVVVKHNQHPNYLAHVLNTSDLRKQKSFGKSKSKVVHMSIKDIEKLYLPIPPIKVQEEIAKILDQFSEYTSSISQGLPAEIELRRKQYEYYRNKLLTF